MKKEIDFLGKKIVYHLHGTGRTVMLVHGFGETGAVWDNQVSFLKDQYQIIVPDLPGSGDSELIDDMTMEGMAEVLKSIFDRESKNTGPSLPALIGHSMGGYITLAFAAKYEDSLSAFGLFHSSAFADSEEKKETRRKGIAFIQEHGAFDFLKTATPKLFSDASKSSIGPTIEQFIKSLNNFSSQSLVYYYEAMMERPDRSNVLKITNLPVLFILGKYDTAIPLEDGLKLCHLTGKAYIHVLHQSGHMGMIEEAEKSNLLLQRFLNEL
jgi:pimeloyl-ACP methyl ester carboxylesterase